MNFFKETALRLMKAYFLPLRNSAVMEITLQKLYKREFWNYYDEVFLKKYAHIYRVCQMIAEKETVVIYDIGGGTGTTVEIFLKELNNPVIHVFEPIKDNFNLIKGMFARNSSVNVHNLAAGASDYSATINVAKRITSSSIKELRPENASLEGEMLNESLEFSRKENIEIRRLKPFLEKEAEVDILKIDVQGFEMEVLKGCGENLGKVRWVVIEVSNHNGYGDSEQYYQIDEFMRQNGFSISDIFPGIRENNILKEWDVIYVRV